MCIAAKSTHKGQSRLSDSAVLVVAGHWPEVHAFYTKAQGHVILPSATLPLPPQSQAETDVQRLVRRDAVPYYGQRGSARGRLAPENVAYLMEMFIRPL